MLPHATSSPRPPGAAQAVAKVIPSLKGKFTGWSLRVPVPTVSIVDFTALLEKDTDTETLRNALKEASRNELNGILEYSDAPLVSSDFKSNPALPSWRPNTPPCRTVVSPKSSLGTTMNGAIPTVWLISPVDGRSGEQVMKTKIVATIGPASNSRDVLIRLIDAGVRIFRLNFSHGDSSAFVDLIRVIRELEQETRVPVTIMQDLSGPKIRIGMLAGPDPLSVAKGTDFCLDPRPDNAETLTNIPISRSTITKFWMNWNRATSSFWRTEHSSSASSSRSPQTVFCSKRRTADS